MGSQSLRGFLSQQSAATFRHYKGSNYREGKTLWIAVDNADVLPHFRGGKIQELSGFRRSEAFIYTRPEGSSELWANPAFAGHRDASFAFAEQVGGVRLTNADMRHVDSDHAFTRAAAGTQERVFFADVGFVRMNLIDKSVNRAWGAGFERRHSHRNFTNELWCEAHFLDLIKALGGRPGSWRDPSMIAFEGVKFLLEQGYIEMKEAGLVFSIGRAEVLDHIQASDEAYAVQSGQVNLEPGKPLTGQHVGAC